MKVRKKYIFIIAVLTIFSIITVNKTSLASTEEIKNGSPYNLLYYNNKYLYENVDIFKNASIADPYILYYNGYYYVYCTNFVAKNKCYKTTDFINWTIVKGADNDGYITDKNLRSNKYRKNFWAPEVYNYNGKFYMFYSSKHIQDGKYYIGMAVADSPEGPFKEVNSKIFNPVVQNMVTNSDQGAIDANVLFDGDNIYLYYVKMGNGQNAIYGRQIWINNDFVTADSKEVSLISPELKWETAHGAWVTEGPCVMKHDGKYYMMYSGCGYTWNEYSVGYAVSNNPLGTYTKKGQILKSNEINVFGPGHNNYFKTSDGSLYTVYHVLKKTIDDPNDGEPRARMFAINKMGFDSNGNLYINGPTRNINEPFSGGAGIEQKPNSVNVLNSSLKSGDIKYITDGVNQYSNYNNNYCEFKHTKGYYDLQFKFNNTFIDDIYIKYQYKNSSTIDMLINDKYLIKNVETNTKKDYVIFSLRNLPSGIKISDIKLKFGNTEGIKISEITFMKINDKTAPIFETEPKLIIGNDKKYYIQFKATDLESGIVSYKITENSDGTGGKTIYCKNKLGENTILRYLDTREVPVTKDGTYYVVITDSAGNKKISNPIKVDVTNPKVKYMAQISASEKKIDNTYYIKEKSEIVFNLQFSEKATLNKEKIKLSGNTNSKLEIKNIKNDGCDIVITGGNKSGKLKIIMEEGFLKDSEGHISSASKKMIDNAGNTIKIVVDNTAPYLKQSIYSNGKATVNVADFNGISSYQWKILNDDKSIAWSGLKQNVNGQIKEIKRTLNLNKYSGKIVQFYVEDILGNEYTVTSRPLKNSVSFISKEENVATYRIVTNLKSEINEKNKESFIKNQSNSEFKIIDITPDPKDTTNRKFLLTVRCEKERNQTIQLPEDIIGLYSKQYSPEKYIKGTDIKINIDNEKPTIQFKDISSKNQKTDLLEFELNDSNSGIKKYQISRGNKIITTVTKPFNSGKIKSYKGIKTISYNGTIKFTVWDNEDNKTEKEITIDNIDRTAPKIQNILYGKPNENGELLVTITTNEKATVDGWISISNNVKQKKYKESELTGTGIKDTVQVIDEAGNEEIVNLIDKIPPRVVGNIEKTAIENEITNVKITFSEEIELSEDQLSSGWILSNNNKTITKNMREDENLVVKDLAGNEIEDILELTIINNASGRLFKNRQIIPNNPNKPTTELVKTINLTRPIQSVDLQELQGYVSYELLNNNTTIKLTYNKKVVYNHRIRLIENDDYAESLVIARARNIVIKGDSNNNGKIESNDLEIIEDYVLGKQIEVDEYKKFAMDINDDGNIDTEDITLLLQLLEK